MYTRAAEGAVIIIVAFLAVTCLACGRIECTVDIFPKKH
jgi:hypothetical protein